MKQPEPVGIWRHGMPPRKEGEPEPPWLTTKLLFKADVPGQRELRDAMRESVEAGIVDMDIALQITWRFLVKAHGGDEQ